MLTPYLAAIHLAKNNALSVLWIETLLEGKEERHDPRGRIGDVARRG